MEHEENAQLVEFDCGEQPLPEGTPAVPRPASRPRNAPPQALDNRSSFQSFDCEASEIAPGTKAEARPPGRERRVCESTPSANLSRPEMLALVERILRTGGKKADVELFAANCKHPAGTDLIFWPHGVPHDPSKPEPTAEEIVEKAMSGRG
jgi:hypothetical protein